MATPSPVIASLSWMPSCIALLLRDSSALPEAPGALSACNLWNLLRWTRGPVKGAAVWSPSGHHLSLPHKGLRFSDHAAASLGAVAPALLLSPHRPSALF